jgi:mRNA interferase MazF
MTKGDIVLITFPFTDLSGTKLRPAVILIETAIDITVCFITAQTNWQESSDMIIDPSPSNGLRKRSLLKTNKIATLDKTLAKGLLGNLSQNELNELDNNLKIIFRL